MPIQKNSIIGVAFLTALLACGIAGAHDGHDHAAEAAAASAASAASGNAPPAPPSFIASTAKPFSALMDDAMAVMDYGMHHAPMNGQQEQDFVTMMIPHHQGAIDMAKALLLTTTDATLRNLAQGLITEQQVEIQLMQAWLQQHPSSTLSPNISKVAK